MSSGLDLSRSFKQKFFFYFYFFFNLQLNCWEVRLSSKYTVKYVTVHVGAGTEDEAGRHLRWIWISHIITSLLYGLVNRRPPSGWSCCCCRLCWLGVEMLEVCSSTRRPLFHTFMSMGGVGKVHGFWVSCRRKSKRHTERIYVWVTGIEQWPPCCKARVLATSPYCPKSLFLTCCG